jgi:PKD repeat protein
VDGPLKVSAGPMNPASGGIANNATDLPVLQVRLTSGDVEPVLLSSLVFSGAGTANDIDDILDAKLWLDVDFKGVAGGSDVLLGTQTYSTDDGTLTFSGLNRTISASQSIDLLLTYSLNGQAFQAETFSASITDRTKVAALQMRSGQTVYTTGTPVQGSTLTVSTDTIPPTFTGLTSAYGIDGAVILDWQAATDATEPIKYGIWFSTESFGGAIAGEPVYLDLFDNPDLEVGGPSPNRAYTVPGLTNGTEYFFVVRARDGAGNWSSNTEELPAVPVAPLLTLQLSAEHGTVGLTPEGGVYPVGTVVIANPLPDDGYAFTAWTGEIPTGQESLNPLAITMDTSKTVQATFVRTKGAVEIRVTPEGLLAPWSLVDGDGVVHDDAGAKPLADVPAGALSLTWGAVPGYIVPTNPAPQYLGNGGTLVLVGNYEMPPAATLDASPIRCYAPQTVHFADQSNPGTRAILARVWTFGDGQTSTEQNPWHEYPAIGDYQVSLTVTTLVGDSTDSITVQVKDHLSLSGTLPAQVMKYAGQDHSIVVTPLGGFEPKTYHWLKDGQPTGTSTAELQFPSLITDDAGTYTCQVTDDLGSSVISSASALQVAEHLSFALSLPEVVEKHYGQSVDFMVQMEGGFEPLIYEWYKEDGTKVLVPVGTNAPEFSIQNLADSDAGMYQVQVTDSYTDSQMDSAILNVTQGVPIAGMAGIAALLGLLAITGVRKMRKK